MPYGAPVDRYPAGTIILGYPAFAPIAALYYQEENCIKVVVVNNKVKPFVFSKA
jgi:hypothetical protein